MRVYIFGGIRRINLNCSVSQSFINFLQLFKDIPDTDRELIDSTIEYRTYKEGDLLSRPNSTCRELFFICNGVLRIVMQNDKGADVTHFFLKENQLCTILNSFIKQVPAEEVIQAACDVEVIVISRPKLYGLYDKIPYLKNLLDQIIQQGLLDKIQLKNAYLGQDSASRYRQFLLRQPEIALRVSLTDIASYLGVTPQSLSRIRKNMR